MQNLSNLPKESYQKLATTITLGVLELVMEVGIDSAIDLCSDADSGMLEHFPLVKRALSDRKRIAS